MLISANVIMRPRKMRKCDNCGKLMNGPTFRVYGKLEKGDKAYTIFICQKCAEDAALYSDGKKIRLALEEMRSILNERMQQHVGVSIDKMFKAKQSDWKDGIKDLVEKALKHLDIDIDYVKVSSVERHDDDPSKFTVILTSRVDFDWGKNLKR